jgi:BirA family transcriptional regulator, biotin operon repressor / biotin---[acetyl-CoA-carboxylase] ligase
METDDLLSLLAAGEPVPAAALRSRLGLTEAALARALAALSAEGYAVAAGPDGLRLLPEAGSLLPAYLRTELQTRVLGRGEMLYAAEMDSTNGALKLAAAGRALPTGSLAVCDRQTRGRGRLNRAWAGGGAGEALACSLLLRPRLPPERTPLLTLAVAVAAADAIADFGFRAGIKWPNDVVLGGRKCVGILCETVTDPAGARCVVAGAGFNVNQTDFPQELADKATSLLLAGGRPIDRRALLCRYLLKLEGTLERLEGEAFEHFLSAYTARSVTLGGRVRVEGARETFVGTAERIDDTGALWVRPDGGAPRRVLSGDVSVRGVMGYV